MSADHPAPFDFPPPRFVPQASPPRLGGVRDIAERERVDSDGGKGTSGKRSSQNTPKMMAWILHIKEVEL
jgi:hypothetical protein